MTGTKDAVIIVGRRVANYHECNIPVPPGFEILPCERCDEQLAISPAGAAQMQQRAEAAVADGLTLRLVGAVCWNCIDHVAVTSASACLTEHAKARLAATD